MMEGLREGAAKQSKFMGITLTRTEIEPMLAEYDALRVENERLRAIGLELIDVAERLSPAQHSLARVQVDRAKAALKAKL
jgi:hypothetical protein